MTAAFYTPFGPQCILARMSVVTTILQQSFKIDCRHFLFFPQPATTNYSRSGPSFPLFFQKFFIWYYQNIIQSVVYRPFVSGPDHMLFISNIISMFLIYNVFIISQLYLYQHNCNLKYQITFFGPKQTIVQYHQMLL